MAAAAIATLGNLHCPPGVDKPIQVSVAKSSTAGRTAYPGGPPQPQPPMGPPGAPYGGVGAPVPSIGMPGLPGMVYGGMPGMAAVGMPGMGGAPQWAPPPPWAPPPQFTPPSAPATVQVNPAGPSDLPVKLFVGSLPGGATTAAVQQIFGQYGQIHEIHLMAPSAKTGDRCAFVSFLSTGAAQCAVEQLNGRFQVPPSPRTIVVQLAKESSKRPRT